MLHHQAFRSVAFHTDGVGLRTVVEAHAAPDASFALVRHRLEPGGIEPVARNLKTLLRARRDAASASFAAIFIYVRFCHLNLQKQDAYYIALPSGNQETRIAIPELKLRWFWYNVPHEFLQKSMCADGRHIERARSIARQRQECR